MVPGERASYLGEARGRHAPGFLCDLLFLAPLLRRSIAARLQAHLLGPLVVVAALAGHLRGGRETKGRGQAINDTLLLSLVCAKSRRLYKRLRRLPERLSGPSKCNW